MPFAAVAKFKKFSMRTERARKPLLLLFWSFVFVSVSLMSLHTGLEGSIVYSEHKHSSKILPEAPQEGTYRRIEALEITLKLSRLAVLITEVMLYTVWFTQTSIILVLAVATPSGIGPPAPLYEIEENYFLFALVLRSIILPVFVHVKDDVAAAFHSLLRCSGVWGLIAFLAPFDPPYPSVILLFDAFEELVTVFKEVYRDLDKPIQNHEQIIEGAREEVRAMQAREEAEAIEAQELFMAGMTEIISQLDDTQTVQEAVVQDETMDDPEPQSDSDEAYWALLEAN